MEKVYIFGHRNPDTDSVTSAISLSYLKNKLGMNTVPAVLSSINLESKFALQYFNTKEPMFLNDVNIKIKDLQYTKNYTVNENDSIYEAYFKMNKAGISKIPVVDKDKNLLGILSMKDIAKDQFSFNYSYIDASYDNICEVIKGKKLLRFDDDIEGNLIVAAYKSTTFIEEINLGSDNILIVGDRHSIIEYAVNSGIKLIIVTGSGEIKKEYLDIARKNKVNIIVTPYNTLETTKVFNLCNNVTTILNTEKVLCTYEDDDINDFIKLANKTRYSYYPVLTKKNKCMGIIRLSDVGFNHKKKVILVDHNSYEQSAIGIEDANIIEIIDHHNIGTIGTNMPISFRNMPVGSTNTIIYLLYKENRVSIPKNIAGLMLSGILSDTLILTSPTTTDYDKEAVTYLSKIAKVNYKEYGYKMIKEGSSLKGMTKEQVLYKDYKNYNLEDGRIGLGQIITADVNDIMKEKDEYIKLLNTVSESNSYLFVCLFITNILENGTYVLFSDRAKEELEAAFGIENIKEGEFLKGIVSRKKQILPVLMNSAKQ
ncbi:MAG: putative manganese-dependent inorganic diphosphatase [Bacilli bacterium]